MEELLNDAQAQSVSGDTPVRYKHYRTINTTAIYVSECGGVMTKSPNRGIRYAKYSTYACPAMKKNYHPIHYPNVHLLSGTSTRHFSVHRLVAEVWLHPKNLFEIQVDHLDGNKMNFHVLNLEWVTKEENTRRRWEAYYKRKAEKRAERAQQEVLKYYQTHPKKKGVKQ